MSKVILVPKQLSRYSKTRHFAIFCNCRDVIEIFKPGVYTIHSIRSKEYGLKKDMITGDGEIERVEIVNDIRDVRYDFKTVFLIFEKGSITIKKPCVYILN